MKIELIKDYAGLKKGAISNPDNTVSRKLIRDGIAKEFIEKPKSKSRKTNRKDD